MSSVRLRCLGVASHDGKDVLIWALLLLGLPLFGLPLAQGALDRVIQIEGAVSGRLDAEPCQELPVALGAPNGRCRQAPWMPIVCPGPLHNTTQHLAMRFHTADYAPP